MTKVYKHLKLEDRVQIATLFQEGNSKVSIAKKLKVPTTKITREINKNISVDGVYRYDEAHKKSLDRRYKPVSKMTKNIALKEIVEARLRIEHSPVQVSGWLKKNTDFKISHETIYKHIWKDQKQGGDLFKHCRHKGKKYNKRAGKTAGRGLIPGRVDIKDRPLIVETKSRIGDFEGDLIIGANHKWALLTFVDRHSKFVKIYLLTGKTADEVTRAILTVLMALKNRLKTLTFDNGKEFAWHQKITKELGIPCFFATPYHSWERGLNEHTNGLIRQYFPKRMEFDRLTREDVQFVEDRLNDRPRKILNFATPREVFDHFNTGCCT